MLLNMLHNGVDGQMGLIMVLFSVPGNHGFGDDVDHLTTPHDPLIRGNNGY